MITRKELITSKEFWLVKFQNALYEQVEKYLQENEISKTEFSKELGVSKGYVSQILNGDFDHKISKFIELSLAIKMIPLLKFESVDTCLYLDEMGALETYQDAKINIALSINYINNVTIEKPKKIENILLNKIGFDFSYLQNQLHTQNELIGLA